MHLRGRRVVIECKATRRAAYSAHWGETTVEMGNANADLGAVVWKRPGHGVDTLEKMRAHLAYMGEDVWKRMLELSGVDPGASRRWRSRATPIWSACRSTASRSCSTTGCPRPRNDRLTNTHQGGDHHDRRPPHTRDLGG